MERLGTVPTRDLLESLPPVDQAPILEKLGALGLEAFKNEYAIDTPVDPETGIVDHDQLIRQVGALVLDTYKWKAPFFDEHHLHWYHSSYASHPENPEVALDFRNLPIHKLWVPRQFHNFVHAVTVPPPVPPFETMRQSVKDFRRKNYLYTIATSAIELRERSRRIKQYASNDEVLYIDPVTKRITRDEDAYEKRRDDFIRFIERHHRKGLLDLSALASIDVRNASSIEAALPEIQEFVGQDIVRMKGHAARRVDLPIDRAA